MGGPCLLIAASLLSLLVGWLMYLLLRFGYALFFRCEWGWKGIPCAVAIGALAMAIADVILWVGWQWLGFFVGGLLLVVYLATLLACDFSRLQWKITNPKQNPWQYTPQEFALEVAIKSIWFVLGMLAIWYAASLLTGAWAIAIAIAYSSVSLLVLNLISHRISERMEADLFH